MRSCILLLAVLSPMLPGADSPAIAQVPRLLSFQGELTSGGVPVPDGAYPMTFRIYDVASGGSTLYSETQPAVPVQGGGFSVILGTFTALDLPFDAPYWIGVQRGSDPEMVPRFPLTAAPYALSLALPFTHTTDVFRDTSLTVLNRYPGGEALRITGALEAFDASGRRSEIRSFPGEGSRAFVADGPLELASFEVDDATDVARMRFVSPGDPSIGALIDVPPPGGDEPTIVLTGPVGSAMLGTRAQDIQLPPESVDTGALADELGIANRGYVPSPEITSSPTILDSVTIVCPDNGYVLVVGRSRIIAQHVSGLLSSGIFGVSSDPLFSPQDVAIRLEHNVPTGGYDFPVQVHSLFPCTPGPHTYYLLGQEGAANDFLHSRSKLALLYIASEYGAVAGATAQGGQADDAQDGVVTGPGLRDTFMRARQLSRTREQDEYRRRSDALREAARLRARALFLSPRWEEGDR